MERCNCERHEESKMGVYDPNKDKPFNRPRVRAGTTKVAMNGGDALSQGRDGGLIKPNPTPEVFWDRSGNCAALPI